jgi:hypothetical protein
MREQFLTDTKCTRSYIDDAIIVLFQTKISTSVVHVRTVSGHDGAVEFTTAQT